MAESRFTTSRNLPVLNIVVTEFGFMYEVIGGMNHDESIDCCAASSCRTFAVPWMPCRCIHPKARAEHSYVPFVHEHTRYPDGV